MKDGFVMNIAVLILAIGIALTGCSLSESPSDIGGGYFDR